MLGALQLYPSAPRLMSSLLSALTRWPARQSRVDWPGRKLSARGADTPPQATGERAAFSFL